VDESLRALSTYYLAFYRTSKYFYENYGTVPEISIVHFEYELELHVGDFEPG
jgi:hypothetical protein